MCGGLGNDSRRNVAKSGMQGAAGSLESQEAWKRKGTTLGVVGAGG